MQRNISLIVLVCIIICNTFCFAIDNSQYNIPVWKDNTDNCNTQVSKNMINLESKSAILMEANTGQILLQHNSNEKLRPASVTKIMTLLLIMDGVDEGTIKLEDQIPCSENARSMGGSQIWLNETETLSLKEMLKAICVVSANDCCVAVAEYMCGSTTEFVNKMNEKAKELGMNNTTFKNCHGLDEDGHLTTANDIAIMSRQLITKHPEITEYTTIWMDYLRDGKSKLVNTNKLIRSYKGITGLKTGSTSLALYNVSATATRDNLSLIAVVMGGPTSQVRFNEASRLLDIGFANYTSKQLCKKGDLYGDIKVEKGKQEYIDVIYGDNANILLKKGDDKNIEKQENIYENIKAPIKKDTKVGEVIYLIEGVEIARTDIITYYDVEKLGLIDNIEKVSNYIFNLGRINK